MAIYYVTVGKTQVLTVWGDNKQAAQKDAERRLWQRNKDLLAQWTAGGRKLTKAPRSITYEIEKDQVKILDSDRAFLDFANEPVTPPYYIPRDYAEQRAWITEGEAVYHREPTCNRRQASIHMVKETTVIEAVCSGLRTCHNCRR